MSNQKDYSEPIMVSVLCRTYNKIEFVRQSLEGVAMQKTNFRFQALVYDDASTDGTAEVVKEFADKYPDIFKPVLRKENLFKKKDGSWERANNADIPGKYLCFCDDDDYWTDPYKLQKQVDYLESHPDCGMVYTQVRILNQEMQQFSEGWSAQTDFEKLLTGANPILNFTACMRTDYFESYFNEMGRRNHWETEDLPVWFYISHLSRIHFMDEVMGVYRILPVSWSHDKDINKQCAFSKSTFDCRCFFAQKYNREDALPVIAKTEVNNLFRLSAQKDQNISSYIYQFAKEHGVNSVGVMVKCLLYSTKWGRAYHRKKYPSLY